MQVKEEKRLRGRPKTLDRDHVLNVSLNTYWKEGIEAISLNEICKRAKVSKPGIYREFGNDDGLFKAVLVSYNKKVIQNIHQIFTKNRPFQETLNQYINILTTENPNLYGCLFLRSRDSNHPLKDESKKQIELMQKEYLCSFRTWIEQAKEKNEFSKNISTELAVNYMDAQVSMAMTKMFNGTDVITIKNMLTLAFSVFKNN